MKTKEQLAEQYAEEQNSAYTNDYYGFLAGYEAAQPKWISVENSPKFNKPILIKYIKGKQGEVVTQGYYQDVAQETADRHLEYAQRRGEFSTNGIETVEFWRKCGYGLTWIDYSGRQIQALNAKTSKNKVIAWMEIP